jgi:hypothetical protein
MAIDSKIRPALASRLTASPVKAPEVPVTKVKVPNFEVSSFEPPTKRVMNKESLGRTVKNGQTDESIGRSTHNGQTDESIGRGTHNGQTDESIGRGQTDESIGAGDGALGRAAHTGQTDESIGGDGSVGDPVREALVGPETDATSLALRDGIFNRLENPTYAADLAKGDPKAVALLKKNLATFAGSLDAASRQQFTSLSSKLDETGLRLLGSLVQKSPDLLKQADTSGGTLLSNLSRLATQPLNANVAGDAKQNDLINSTLLDVVNPNRIDQGSAPTCTVTSIQFELVADSPAEYTRILADLTGPASSSKMLGGGSLKTEAGDAALAVRDGRTLSESLFQTAAMEYANGRYADFNPTTGVSTDSRNGKVHQGIVPQQQTNLLEQLFNLRYSTKSLFSEAEGQKMLESLRGFDATKSQNRPVILQIDQGKINHAVTLEKISDGRVLFRDPYGALRSMPEELFPKYVVGVQRPIEK